mgnify:CR=1 FL=1
MSRNPIQMDFQCSSTQFGPSNSWKFLFQMLTNLKRLWFVMLSVFISINVCIGATESVYRIGGKLEKNWRKGRLCNPEILMEYFKFLNWFNWSFSGEYYVSQERNREGCEGGWIGDRYRSMCDLSMNIMFSLFLKAYFMNMKLFCRFWLCWSRQGKRLSI